MSRYREQFPNKTLLPVIHVEAPVQAVTNAAIARDNGADGVFLINHHISTQWLMRAYWTVRSEHPDWFVGLNFLSLTTPIALGTVPADASALWADDGGVSGSKLRVDEYARARRARPDWEGLYFASAAFKYLDSIWTPDAAAAFVAQGADVVVTSGTATGSAPNPAKIAAMRAAIAATPLAIASGITAANVEQFMGTTDCFMVATGISRDECTLDPYKVRELADIIHRG